MDNFPQFSIAMLSFQRATDLLPFGGKKKTYFLGLQLQLGGLHGSIWIIPEEQNKSTTDLAINKHSYVTIFLNRHVYVNIVYYAHTHIYIHMCFCLHVYYIYIYIYVLQNPNCLITRGYLYSSMHFPMMISIIP